MKSSLHRVCCRRPAGFSLIEVTMALGIVTFAVIVILGLFGSLNQRAAETTARRAAVGEFESLRNFLKHQTAFTTVYGWAKAGPKDLIFVRYRADASGAPVAGNGAQIRSGWFELPLNNATNYELAREGRWVGARLNVSNLNPQAPSAMPATAANYTNSAVIFDVDLFVIPGADGIPANAKKVLSGSVGVSKL